MTLPWFNTGVSAGQAQLAVQAQSAGHLYMLQSSVFHFSIFCMELIFSSSDFLSFSATFQFPTSCTIPQNTWSYLPQIDTCTYMKYAQKIWGLF